MTAHANLQTTTEKVQYKKIFEENGTRLVRPLGTVSQMFRTCSGLFRTCYFVLGSKYVYNIVLLFDWLRFDIIDYVLVVRPMLTPNMAK